MMHEIVLSLLPVFYIE